MGQSCLAPPGCVPTSLKSAVFTAGFCSICLYTQRGQASNIIHPSANSCFAIWHVSSASTILQHPTPPHHSLFATVAAKINGVPEETPQQKSMPGPHLCVSQEALNIFQDRADTNYPSESVSGPGLSISASWLQAFCFDTALWQGNYIDTFRWWVFSTASGEAHTILCFTQNTHAASFKTLTSRGKKSIPVWVTAF